MCLYYRFVYSLLLCVCVSVPVCVCASANSTSYHIKHTFFSRYEHGVTGVLEEISNIDEKEEGNCVVVFVLLLKSVTRTGLHFSGYFSLCLFLYS